MNERTPHRQWEEKEQFPPYEFALDIGWEMFTTPFKNGKSYADCFANQGIPVVSGRITLTSTKRKARWSR